MLIDEKVLLAPRFKGSRSKFDQEIKRSSTPPHVKADPVETRPFLVLLFNGGENEGLGLSSQIRRREQHKWKEVPLVL